MGLLYVKTEDGRKKPSVFVWLGLLGVLLGVSIFLVTNTRETGLDELTGNTKRAKEEKAPIPVEKAESKKADEIMDTQTRNEMDTQIQRETNENNGFLSQDRRLQIEEKYRQLAQERARANFQPTTGNRITKMQRPDPTPTPAPSADKEKIERPKYKTLAERLAEVGGKSGGKPSAGGTSGKSLDFARPKNGADATPLMTTNTPTGDKTPGAVRNFLPLGTFIPCVLDGDIVTSDLASHVWANVVIDVTFRRQLQLPKGLVKLRGKTALEPTQDVVDVMFDTMVFSDGTELPIMGFAYAAFDPRYPHRFRTRGIPGEIIVPPMWVKLQSLILSAALGASDAYIQNYINENTSTPSTWVNQPVINPTTGQVTTQMVQQQGQPVNNQIGATIGLSAAQSALEDLVQTVQRDAEKYKPYLIVEKGTPFFIQLDSTVNIDSRRVNGYALFKEEEMRRNIELAKQGVPMPDTKEVYPPGDARAKYSGLAGSQSNQPEMAALQNAQASINNARAAANNQQQTPTAGGALGTSGGAPGASGAGVNNLQQLLRSMQQ